MRRIYSWRNSYKDQIRAFRTIATRQPFFSIEDINNNVDLFDVCFNGDSSYSALRAAAWHEAPLVSFPTRSPWLDSPLNVTVEKLDQEGGIKQSSLDLINFFSLAIFEQHSTALLEKRNDLIRSGKRILDEKESFFPGLIFCGKAIQQLRNWSAGHIILDQVKESLTVLIQVPKSSLPAASFRFHLAMDTLAVRLTLPHRRVCRGLAPPSECALPGAHKKIGMRILACRYKMRGGDAGKRFSPN